MEHRKEHVVTVAETDLLGIVSNPRIFEWFSNSRVDLYMAAGLIEIVKGMPRFVGTDGAVVVMSEYSKVNFLKPMRFGDKIEVISEVVNVGAREVLFSQAVCLKENVLAVTATSIHTYVDGQTFKPLDVPDHIQERLLA